jgi:uncharacterized protein YodC (DUF2158 family)
MKEIFLKGSEIIFMEIKEGEINPGDINSGDIVSLKSGGVQMTVGHIENGMATCYWFYEGNPGEHSYPLVCLKKYKEVTVKEIEL